MKEFCSAVMALIRAFTGADSPSADLEIETMLEENGASSVTVRPAQGKTFRFEVEVDPEALAKREDLPDGGVKFTSRLPLKVEPAPEFTGEDDLVRVRLTLCPDGAPHDHVVVQVPNDKTLVCEIEIRSAIVSVVAIPLGGADDGEEDVDTLVAEAEAAYDAAGWPSVPESD